LHSIANTCMNTQYFLRTARTAPVVYRRTPHASEPDKDGFFIGIMNQRGGYTKAPLEGGNQQCELAGKYCKLLDECNVEGPVTVAALRAVAPHY
jgi:hypothetical protein